MPSENFSWINKQIQDNQKQKAVQPGLSLADLISDELKNQKTGEGNKQTSGKPATEVTQTLPPSEQPGKTPTAVTKVLPESEQPKPKPTEVTKTLPPQQSQQEQQPKKTAVPSEKPTGLQQRLLPTVGLFDGDKEDRTRTKVLPPDKLPMEKVQEIRDRVHSLASTLDNDSFAARLKYVAEAQALKRVLGDDWKISIKAGGTGDDALKTNRMVVVTAPEGGKVGVAFLLERDANGKFRVKSSLEIEPHPVKGFNVAEDLYDAKSWRNSLPSAGRVGGEQIVHDKDSALRQRNFATELRGKAAIDEFKKSASRVDVLVPKTNEKGVVIHNGQVQFEKQERWLSSKKPPGLVHLDVVGQSGLALGDPSFGIEPIEVPAAKLQQDYRPIEIPSAKGSSVKLYADSSGKVFQSVGSRNGAALLILDRSLSIASKEVAVGTPIEIPPTSRSRGSGGSTALPSIDLVGTKQKQLKMLEQPNVADVRTVTNEKGSNGNLTKEQSESGARIGATEKTQAERTASIEDELKRKDLSAARRAELEKELEKSKRTASATESARTKWGTRWESVKSGGGKVVALAGGALAAAQTVKSLKDLLSGDDNEKTKKKDK